jgi:DNA-binding protein H-NS
MATYKKLKAQAEELMRRAEAARKAEIAAVVGEIRARMAECGITVADLGRVIKRKAKRTKTTVPAKYRHPKTGEAWSGRGLTPRWLAAELAKGKKKESFLVK